MEPKRICLIGPYDPRSPEKGLMAECLGHAKGDKKLVASNMAVEAEFRKYRAECKPRLMGNRIP